MRQTLAQKLVARAAGRSSVAPGEIVTCKVDLAMVHDSSGPRRLKPRLERIPGVGSIQLVGHRPREIRIWIDPVRLSGYGLAVDDIVSTLVRERREGDHVVIMSNGGFGGIHGKLLEALRQD